tara:strand:- start:382 stop:777 length:396 start_codon:yes stop_codon:yes gene_type:complete
MGLDAYLYSYKGKNRKEVDFTHNTDFQTELYYWRKNPNLEAYMSDLYFSKGGIGTASFGSVKSFNCCKVELKEEDIKTLQELVISDNLPTGGGFFHGGNSDEHYKEETLEALKDAANAIEEGDRVYYTSWW